MTMSGTNTDSARTYGYRWVILFAIFPIILANEVMWLSIAPISDMAEEFYGVGSGSIALLSVSYMVMFIVFSVPASWVIDRFGFRPSLIIGALLTAVFGVVRAAFGDSFPIVLTAQFIIAIGQPFLLNISTKVPANWFPITERSTAAGILTMAQYFGFAVPMVLSPIIAGAHGIPMMLWWYAAFACVAAVVAIALTKEKPPVAPPGPVAESEDFSLATIKQLLHNRDYVKVLFVCFLSLGILNTVLTVTEAILVPRGVTTAEAGVIGGAFVLAGVLGAIMLPVISDRAHRRVPYFLAAQIILTAVYVGMTILHGFAPLLLVALIGGFTIMGVGPILFQHGTEVSYPVQEGTSLGLLLLMGQVSGALFVYGFEGLNAATGNVAVPMLMVVALTIVQIPVVARMKESRMISKAEEQGDERVL
ncbi:MAG: MFS transporter [Ancrocorticia sp.]|jgi:FLVCR family MFS transporter 7|nr:MFS transporter [Ancrocorticia sp.]